MVYSEKELGLGAGSRVRTLLILGIRLTPNTLHHNPNTVLILPIRVALYAVDGREREGHCTYVATEVTVCAASVSTR